MKVIYYILPDIILMVLSTHAHNRANFEQYKVKFDKNYNTEQENQYRLMIFEANLKKIQEINNNPKNTWKAAVNHLTDRLPDEIISLMGYNRNLAFFSHKSRVFNTPSSNFLQNLPIEVDWRTKDVVNPVKDQGGCGSCWAFSTASVLESHIAIQTEVFLSNN